MDTRLQRAILKWAKITEQPLNQWAVKQWIRELSARTESVETILEHMKYLVAKKERPTLMGIIRSLENGLPRDWTGRQSMYQHADDGVTYFGMCVEAFESRDPWGKLRECIDFGMTKAPHVDWSAAIRECEEKMRK